MACYTMAVGQMFDLIASATASVLNGEDQRQVLSEIAEKLEKSVKAVRCYAEMYFEISAADMNKFDPSFMAKAPSVEILFDIGGNLVSMAAREMEFFCESYNEDPQQKIMVIEANLQIIEMMLEEVKSVH